MNNLNNADFLFTKIPPQSKDLECAVLGAILIEKDAYPQVADILKPESFYVESHSIIFSIMQRLVALSQPIDLMTVTEELLKQGKLENIGGAFYLSELTNLVASSSNIEYHARIVLQKAIQRDLINISNTIIKDSYEDTVDVFDLLSNAEIQLDAIKSSIYGSSVTSAYTVSEKIKKDILLPPGKPLSVPSILDIRHDFGTVDCFAAKAGTGKTAVLIQGSVTAAKEGYNSGILSAELHKRLLTAKYHNHITGVSAKRIIRNELTEYDKNDIFNTDLSVMQSIYIDDSALTSLNIRSKIITLVKKFNCKVIWIDYIQLINLITNKNQTDVKGMELVMTILQQTAKELYISIIILSQLTRGTDKPTMENLRSGGIEQACSKIFLLHDENYKETQGVPFLNIPYDIRGKIELIDDKNRFDDKSNRTIYYDKIKQTMQDWNLPRGNFMDEMQEQPQKTPDVF